MNREYRNELPELKEKPTEQIYGIYIIPYKEYNGFWGKNGYKSYDFIFENKHREKIGWCHWEGDVIHLENNYYCEMNIDCAIKNDYLRLFTTKGFEISDMIISDLEIKTKGE